MTNYILIYLFVAASSFLYLNYLYTKEENIKRFNLQDCPKEAYDTAAFILSTFWFITIFAVVYFRFSNKYKD